MIDFKLDVLFKDRKINTNLKELVQYDYNSMRLNFIFDVAGARYVFKLKGPNGDTILIDDIVNNQYVIPAGTLNQVGYYYYEISVYDSNAKLTNYAKKNFYVRDVLINTDEIVVPDDRVPVLDRLINEVDNIDIDVSKSGTTATVEVTKKDGTSKSVQILDGETGPIGATPNIHIGNVSSGSTPNVSRRGTDTNPIFDFILQPGYTPQKGIDYYTEEEKEEMIDYIVNDANSEFNRNVNEKTTAFNTNATNKTTDFNSNASSKLDTYNSNHTSKMSAYNQNATDKTSTFDTNATNKTTAYDNNASSKLTAYNDNATEKLSAYNTNHTEKLTAYNDNASDKLDEYNDNAQEKIDEFNENKEELQREVDYYKSTLNALPKVEGEGTSLTLDDTAEAPMKMSLGANTEQASTTGKNLFAGIPFESANSGQGYIQKTDGYATIISSSNNSVTFKNTVAYGGIESNYISVNANEKYTISLNYTNITNRFFVTQYNNNKERITTLNSPSNFSFPLTFTATDDGYITIAFTNTTLMDNNCVLSNIQVETGSSATDYEPYTNGPSPNPEYPQDIHTISGDNEIDVLDKNLVNIFDTNAFKYGGGVTNTTVNFDGTIKTTSNYASSRNKGILIENLRHNTDYTVSFIVDSITTASTRKSFQLEVRAYNSDNTYNSTIAQQTYTSTGLIKKTFNSGTYDKIAIHISGWYNVGDTGTLTYHNLMVELGDTFTSYTSYQEQSLPLNLGDLEYCKIGDNEDKFILTTGKNLFNWNRTLGVPSDITFAGTTKRTFNYNEFVKGFAASNLYSAASTTSYSVSNGTISTLSQQYYGLGFPVKIEANMEYTLSFKKQNSSDRVGISYFQEDGTYISATTTFGTKTFTTPSNCDFIVLTFNSNNENSTCTFWNIQLEKGPYETEYEPYGSGKWYLKKNIYKKVFDGTESWQTNGTSGTDYRHALALYSWPDSEKPIGINYTYLSNYFIAVNRGNNADTFGKFYAGENFFVFHDKNAVYDNDGFKNWLNSHNTIVYYVTYSPTYILLNDTLQSQLTEIYKWVKAYQNQTNISQVNNDLPFVIKASAVKDLNKVIASLTNAIIEIGGE